MFNYKQFKQKKKRVMNPDIPRPNLFSHEKHLKETDITIEELKRTIEDQQQELRILKNKFANMQTSIEQLISYMRRNK
mgnify:CR=1 FL=1